MKICLLKGLKTGVIFGVLFIFMILTGFVRVGAEMIGGFLSGGAGSSQDAVHLLLFIAVLGFLAGFSMKKIIADANWIQSITSGVGVGLAGGALSAAVILVIGLQSFGGTDFRTYLPNLGPEQVRFLLFSSTPISAAQAYMLYFFIFSLVGILFAKLLTKGQWLHSAFSKVKESVSNLDIPVRTGRWFENKLFVIVMLVLVGVLLYYLPLVWGSYWNYIMGTVAIYILLGLGLNIIVGYSGQLVLGYVAFFASGAYTFALLTAPTPHAIGMNLWLAVGCAVLVSTLTGLLLGLPILNLRGDYLAIVTLGFGEIVRILIRSDLLTPLTNGPRGVTNILQPTWRGQVFSDVNFTHLLMLVVLAGLFVAKRLKDSRTGRAWIAVREDETVARATGVNTYQYKLLSLLLGAAFAGLSGALFASRNQFTGPEDFSLMVSVNVLCIVIVGGMGSLPGIVLGAFVLKGLPELLRQLSDYRLLVFGALLVVMMIIRPEGLWPVNRKRFLSAGGQQIEEQPAEVEL